VCQTQDSSARERRFCGCCANVVVNGVNNNLYCYYPQPSCARDCDALSASIIQNCQNDSFDNEEKIMKFRTGFVTCPGSSYMAARKMELTEKQREVLMNFVEKIMFRRDVSIDTRKSDAKALNVEENNCRIQTGDNGDSYSLAELYCELWNALEAAESKDFGQE